MARKRWLRVLALAVPVAAGIGLAVASFDYCGAWPEQPPVVSGAAWSNARLLAGAARVPLDPALPTRPAGYGPFVPSVAKSDGALHARALVLESGALRLGLLELEVLLVPDALAAALRADARAHGVDELIVVASHTHTSFGGYDDRLFAQVVGTGGWDPATQAMIRAVGAEALAQAARAVQPVELEVSHRRVPEWVRSRADYPAVDDAVSWVRLHAGGRDVAELLIFAAHPTLTGKAQEALSADYPGAAMSRLEEDGGIALFLPAVVGNATARLDQAGGPVAYGRGVAELALQGERSPQAPQLGFARASFTLPRPDASRLVPWPLRRATENLICASSGRTATVSVLELGAVSLRFVPAEITAAAAPGDGDPAARVVSMTDGYIGYVESAERVEGRGGESRRQYFGPGLAGRVGAALDAARAAIDHAREGGGR